jgi:hypothetical protein
VIDGGLLQDAVQMKLGVLSVMSLIVDPWGLTASTAIKNCFVKFSFLIENVSTNDNSAMKLDEDEEVDRHSLLPLGVQSEDYPTYDSALEVCGVWSIDHTLVQHLTMPE